jgi:hypothetical protein
MTMDDTVASMIAQTDWHSGYQCAIENKPVAICLPNQMVKSAVFQVTHMKCDLKQSKKVLVWGLKSLNLLDHVRPCSLLQFSKLNIFV